MTPPARWSADELARRALLEQGLAVAVNLRRQRNLIAWAKERGLFVRVDRATPWGNPFVIGRDGDRATVIARYRDEHLPSRPDLLARVGELRGKALGCWCAPLACHADVLAAKVSGMAPAPRRPTGGLDLSCGNHDLTWRGIPVPLVVPEQAP